METAVPRPDTNPLDTIAEQAREIARLQVAIARGQIMEATLQSHNAQLKERLEQNLKTMLDNEMNYTKNINSLKELSETMKRLSTSVEVIASTATTEQRLEARLDEMAGLFSGFEATIVEYGQERLAQYERLAAEREETERRYKESLDKRDVRIVLLDG